MVHFLKRYHCCDDYCWPSWWYSHLCRCDLRKGLCTWEELWNVHLIMTEFHCPEVTLCGWQDFKIQLLINTCVVHTWMLWTLVGVCSKWWWQGLLRGWWNNCREWIDFAPTLDKGNAGKWRWGGGGGVSSAPEQRESKNKTKREGEESLKKERKKRWEIFVKHVFSEHSFWNLSLDISMSVTP